MPLQPCCADRWLELAIQHALHLSTAAISDCARALRQPGQSLDRVPAPAGKTHQHDRRRRWPEYSRPDEIHTRLLEKNRKLLHRPSRLRPEYGIRLAKAWLSTPRQFL